MQRFCLALDLIDDQDLIAEYIDFHRNVWPEIQKSIKDSGIQNMEIYHIGDRLFMIMETNAGFSFEEKAKFDASNPKVQEWETLMWKFQKALPQAKSGEKWILMDKIFELK
ncbi:L-rhamnose mutarotase [Flavobacterium sp. FlaQc-48]|uniref:L-rhamnose mutarotase n=1 Tax=Flavobacterium sp. FlaQc-48 TaxID=3374181 RepID=UPI0037583AA4